jgi:DNA-directed RNA polymerase specialized sigma24 family protein
MSWINNNTPGARSLSRQDEEEVSPFSPSYSREQTLADILPAGPEYSPFVQARIAERKRILNQCEEGLTGRQMFLLLLRYDAGLTWLEISVEMGVSENAVWKMHVRILHILRKQLEALNITDADL